MTEFTPIVPTLAGVTFATTDVVVATGMPNTIPISSDMRTLVVITNNDAGGAHTVTFGSQTDTWGNAPSSAASDLNKTISVPASTTIVTGVWVQNRWASACTVYYDGAGWPSEEELKGKKSKESKDIPLGADSPVLSLAVINVPNANKY
jgi:hypothetical protein